MALARGKRHERSRLALHGLFSGFDRDSSRDHLHHRALANVMIGQALSTTKVEHHDAALWRREQTHAASGGRATARAAHRSPPRARYAYQMSPQAMVGANASSLLLPARSAARSSPLIMTHSSLRRSDREKAQWRFDERVYTERTGRNG
jgi:hypothetical protein